jgi:DNA topoisomerase VI subunit B
MEYEPKVNKNREFKEIAADFSNPLDAVREAISNSLDAKASDIKIGATSEKIDTQDKLVLIFEDNGNGMNEEGIKSFFDLGNSTWDDGTGTIGEKGHGTKIFYRSEILEVETIDTNGKKITAKVVDPWITLNKKEKLKIDISNQTQTAQPHGTKIKITGFYDNKATFLKMQKFEII